MNKAVPASSSVSEITLPTSQWLTAKEAAAYLKIAPRTLLGWARTGQIKGYVLSGTQRVTWRFLRVDLDAMLFPAVRALENRKTA